MPVYDDDLKAKQDFLKEHMKKLGLIKPRKNPEPTEPPTVETEREKRKKNKEPTGSAWGVYD